MRRYPQPDPDTVEIMAVNCYGCGRKVGVTHENKSYVFCEELCWRKEQLPSLENAARDRFIRLMSEKGVSQIKLAAAFDMTRTRVYQILIANGNDVDYLQAGRK